MGTLREWIEVVVSGGLWVVLLAFFSRRPQTSSLIRKSETAHRMHFLDYVSYGFGGIFFGMGVTFGTRVFRGRLGITAMAILAVAIPLGFARRRAVASTVASASDLRFWDDMLRICVVILLGLAFVYQGQVFHGLSMLIFATVVGAMIVSGFMWRRADARAKRTEKLDPFTPSSRSNHSPSN